MVSLESVTPGHPDKLADRISDSILDAVLLEDPYGRVACETLVTLNEVIISGEISFNGSVDIEGIVRKVVKEVGYNDKKYLFYDGCFVRNLVNKQSQDISMGVSKKDLGAGDQGNMFGYATNESENLMPIPLNLINKLTQSLYELRSKLGYLGPDGKTQITYNKGEVRSLVISVQHDAEIKMETLKKDLNQHIIQPQFPNCKEVYINPTGRFVIGGPAADTGLTGRKIIIDSYGPFCKHGGGAFSGKDPTKVDRSGAYAARWIAKNVVAAKLASLCEVQLSYIIGVSYPISLNINTFGTGIISDREISNLVSKKFDLRPGAIIERLDLRRSIYAQLSSYGHFGRENLGLAWEKLDMVQELKQY